MPRPRLNRERIRRSVGPLWHATRRNGTKVRALLLRPAQGKALVHAHDFLPAALDAHRRPPSPAGRAFGLIIMVFATLMIAWACIAEMDIVVMAQGRIVPGERVKVIQPVDTGVVRAIHVRDGQRVSRGDLLIELDPTVTGADRERLAREWLDAQLDVMRLDAQIQNDPALFTPPAQTDAFPATIQQRLLASRLNEYKEKLAVLDAEVARRTAERDSVRDTIIKIETGLPLMRRKLEMREALAARRYLSESMLIDAKLELINYEKELVQQRHRRHEAEANLTAAIRSRRHGEAELQSRMLAELSDAARRRDVTGFEYTKAERRHELQQLRAPVDGVVQQLAVNTVGGVVTTAQPLLVVVPESENLEVEAQVQNKDIGFVTTGQHAAIKVETYEFTRFGVLDGVITWVGTDAVNDQKLGPVYPVRIALADTHTANTVQGKRGAVTPGMNITADIRIGTRRIIEYFLAPVLRYQDESLRER